MIGETCIDHYVYGKCNRLSPEAPVPIVDVTHTKEVLGMSANVKENLEKLGCSVYHITNSNEIIKTRIIDTRYNSQIVRLDEEHGLDTLSLDHIRTLRQDLIDNAFDAAIISDYNKGFLTPKAISDLVSLIKETNPEISIFVDTKKKDCSPYSGVILKINERERSLIEDPGKGNTIITTLGEKGAEYLGVTYPAIKTEVSDVCGAGDTFISSLVFAYLCEKRDLKKAIKFSNISSSISVRRLGVYSPTMEDLEKEGVTFEKQR